MKSKVFRLIKSLLFVAVIALLGARAHQYWSQLPPLKEPDPAWLAASLSLGLGALLLIPLLLQLILNAHGLNVPYKRAIGLYFVPTQGKYLPGKVWSFVWAVSAYQKEGASWPTALSCLIILTTINLATGALVGLAFGFSFLDSSATLLATTICLLLILHPRVFYGSLNFALGLFKKEPLPGALQGKDLAKLLLINCVHWLLLGLGLACLCRASLGEAVPALTVVSIQALAYVAGILAFFAPAGLGVREGVVAFLLTPVLGAGPALIVSVLQRLWQIALETPCAGLGWYLLRDR